jgi:type IV pilus assembly protein PilY1
MNRTNTLSRVSVSIGFALITMVSTHASLAEVAVVPPLPPPGALQIRETPLFLTDNVPPLNMLVVGRDHKLYYEAYNDASDLNGDGQLDVGFRPEINYYGYFDGNKCYGYSSGTFVPTSVTLTGKCSGAWSGQWLNYVTTARIDALRKVLYGGSRSTDTATDTVLERSFIPQDAHSWGKEYESIARDGYDIREYTPLPLPNAGARHLFGNTTRLYAVANGPLLRVLQNSSARVWNWASRERPVVEDQVDTVGYVVPTDYVVRVKVCVTGLLEENCKAYPNGNYKPAGLIHDYGETDTMYFGLITGSYEKNTDGGVLRKQVSSFRDEIDVNNGSFLGTNPGIVHTLDRLSVTGFTNATWFEYTDPADNCGWITDGPITSGRCPMWGNPVSEMMYESLRYFAGKGAPTSAFNIAATGNRDAQLGLSRATWNDPYTGGSTAQCAKPFQTVISDINNSYDTDKLPGTRFGSFSGDVTGLDVGALGDQIWANEMGAPGNHFIGQSAGTYDGAPTVKSVSSFSDIRGLAPEEPTKEGGYYAASVAYHGFKTDINPVAGNQRVQTFAVALASPLPKIEIPVNGQTITVVPFAKSVGGCLGVNGTQGAFQPTNTIVDFYVEQITPTYGSFRVNFEDVEQGADHDMDAIVRYEYEVQSGGRVDIRLTSEYAAGCIIQHMGYVISGTDGMDGTYLEVRDVDTAEANDVDYFLDVPDSATSAQTVGTAWLDGDALPLTSERRFTVGSTSGATLLKDPLWFAAKWGGFNDRNGDLLPQSTEWDANSDGNPDNYFLVTNALTLKDKLASAFDEIIVRVGSASSASVNASSINSETRIYQALFSTGDWSGSLVSIPINLDGTLEDPEWNAASLIPEPTSRKIATVNTGDVAVPFRWLSLDSTRHTQMSAGDGTITGQRRVDYLRGDRTREVRNGGTMRNRNPLTVLGDFVSSSPAYVAAPRARYRDSLESVAYSSFKSAQAARTKMLYAGANDGMLHAFDATTGAERWAFVPGTVFNRLHSLTRTDYQHRFYVDGAPVVADAFWGGAWRTALVGGLNRGGQGVYALDITDPAAATETSVASKFLWEFNDSDDADMGYSYSRPVITRMANGTWVAIFGNGYNNTEADGIVSTTGQAVLYIVNLQSGAIIRKITTGVGMAQDPLGVGRPNGLSSVLVADINDDSVADYAYAGDLFGNVWKFNLASATVTSWDVAYKPGGVPAPIFQARNSANVPQAITTRPQVGFGPGGRSLMVYVGTGKFLELRDRLLPNLTTQTFYGFTDLLTNTYTTDVVSGRAQLTEQTITTEVSFDASSAVRLTSNNPLTPGSRGWYIDFVSPVLGFQGEMLISDPVLRNDRVLFNTLIPNPDPCGFGGKSWLFYVDAFSGSRLERSFDLNADGDINGSDTIEIPDGSGGTIKVPASAVQMGDGVDSQPKVVIGGTDAFVYSSTTGAGRETRGGGPPGACDPNAGGCTEGNDSNIKGVGVDPGPGFIGRQSWRQIR